MQWVGAGGACAHRLHFSLGCVWDGQTSAGEKEGQGSGGTRLSPVRRHQRLWGQGQQEPGGRQGSAFRAVLWQHKLGLS